MNLSKMFITALIFLFLTGCETTINRSQSTLEKDVSATESLTVLDASGTEIPLAKKPEEIACLHLSCIDILAELGMKPVAVHFRLHSLASSPIYFGEAGQDIIPIAGHAEPNLEQLLSLKPDLIIGHLAQLASQREMLKPIAPLYVLEVKTYTDAIDNLNAIAQLTGKTEQAEIAVQAFQNKLADYKEKSPKNQTVLVTNGTAGNFYVATDQSLVGSTLAEVANYPWTLSNQVPSAINWVTFSQEEILKINPDVIFVLVPSANPNRLAQLQKDAFWKELKAVKNGRVYELEDAKVGGLTTGTRSLSYLLDEIMPKLYPDIFGLNK